MKSKRKSLCLSALFLLFFSAGTANAASYAYGLCNVKRYIPTTDAKGKVSYCLKSISFGWKPSLNGKVSTSFGVSESGYSRRENRFFGTQNIAMQENENDFSNWSIAEIEELPEDKDGKTSWYISAYGLQDIARCKVTDKPDVGIEYDNSKDIQDYQTRRQLGEKTISESEYKEILSKSLQKMGLGNSCPDLRRHL